MASVVQSSDASMLTHLPVLLTNVAHTAQTDVSSRFSKRVKMQKQSQLIRNEKCYFSSRTDDGKVEVYEIEKKTFLLFMLRPGMA